MLFGPLPLLFLCSFIFHFRPGCLRLVFKQVKNLSERSKKMKEQKKNKGSALVAQNLQ